jgi:type VI secretion system FHA domain protein
MTLTLSIVRCPDLAAPEMRQLQGGDFSIGRGAENDWVLSDPERHLSKRHCLIAYRSGGWQVADLSTNGTYLNHETDPIGRDAPRDLSDGDRLRCGAYEIEVRIVEEDGPRMPSRSAAEPLGDPFALDPFRSAPAEAASAFDSDPLLQPQREGDPFAVDLGPSSASLPADYDPLAPDPADSPFAGPVQADHAPHLDDAFRPGVAHPVIPEDWDRDLRSPEPPRPAEEVPPPERRPALPGRRAAPPERRVAPPSLPPAPVPPELTAPPHALTAPSHTSAADDDLLALFFRGAQLNDVRLSDPAAAIEALGEVFRAFVSGLRQALVARAAVKAEFRIEQTTIQARGNNPLKFSASDEDALAGLLGAGRRSDMSPVEAVTEALRDIRLHELASVAAMQSAARALLAELDPARLRESAGHGGLDFVATQRKAHAWDAFEAAHARIARALEDDFDSVFGKAFARAYERALDDISARDRA